jgi:hypothetical protein
MFFSRLAVLLAILAFVIGVLSVLLRTAVTMDLLDEATRARYVSRSPEQAIYGGLYVILASVALGGPRFDPLCVHHSKPLKYGLSPTAKFECAGINTKACRGESRALNGQLILLRKG